MRAAIGILALLLAGGGCSTLFSKTGLPGASLASASSGETIMPRLVGMTRDQAAAAVRAAGFTQEVESSTPLECEGAPRVEGRVSCQSPPAGKLVKKYTLVQISVYAPQRIAGAIVRDQLAALVGKSPAEARAALEGYGHDGDVKVAPGPRFYEGCGKDRVCAFSVPESGMGIHDPITLFVNPGLAIATPD
jgi:hypothetical protein